VYVFVWVWDKRETESLGEREVELRERDMGNREMLMTERHGDQISKVLIKKNKKYYLNKIDCIIDKLMWEFLKSNCVE